MKQAVTGISQQDPKGKQFQRVNMATKKNTTIDQGLIKDLANLLTETDLTEIEVEQDDLRIRVSRASSQQTLQVAAPVLPSTPASTSVTHPAASDAGAASKVTGNVPSPMVGTAYYSPAPGADPYVKVGDVVKKGQTVMIVEAMKTMNQIATPVSGTVAAILVDDGQPVEFGEQLLLIE